MAQFTLTDSTDQWVCIWGSSLFSCNKAYKSLIGHADTPRIFSWLCKCSCQPKHKFFFWLLLKDRLSTRNLLKWRNMELQSYTCVLCGVETKESLDHLFISCPFALACWHFVDIQVDPTLPSAEQMLMAFRDQLQCSFLHGDYCTSLLDYLDSV